MALEIKIKLLDKEIPLPKYACSNDAGLDLYSTAKLFIKPHNRVVVPCGFCLEIPPGYCGLVLPRSGLAAKFGITCLNAPGLIDAGYRGEIKVILINHDPKNTFIVEKYDRIAQLVIVPVANVYLNEVEYLNESERGDQGFGHSGFRN